MLETPLAWQADSLQQNFRCLLEAMSRPGSIQPIDHYDKDCSIAEAILAPLLDNSISLADPHQLLSQNARNFSQAQSATPDDADYIICLASVAPQFCPRQGTLEDPHLSATVLLQVDSLNQGNVQGYISGPGVAQKHACRLTGVHPAWIEKRQLWSSAFPLGVDFIFFDENGVLALPRTSLWEFH